MAEYTLRAGVKPEVDEEKKDAVRDELTDTFGSLKANILGDSGGIGEGMGGSIEVEGQQNTELLGIMESLFKYTVKHGRDLQDKLERLVSINRKQLISGAAGGGGGLPGAGLLSRLAGGGGGMAAGALGIVGAGIFGSQFAMGQGALGEEGEKTLKGRRRFQGLEGIKEAIRNPLDWFINGFKTAIDPTGIGETLVRKLKNEVTSRMPESFKQSFNNGVQFWKDAWSKLQSDINNFELTWPSVPQPIKNFTDSLSNFNIKEPQWIKDIRNFKLNKPSWLSGLGSGMIGTTGLESKIASQIPTAQDIVAEFDIPDFEFDPEVNINIDFSIDNLADEFGDEIRDIATDEIENELQTFRRRLE